MIENLIFLFEFWIQTSWYIAFVMSLVTNLGVYFFAAYLISFVSYRITKNKSLAYFIDERDFKKGQIQSEIKNGIIACVTFALVSLLARELFVGIIPKTVSQLCIEVLVFTIFYETYSYFVHRLLHIGYFRKAHSVHHYSVRVTPWSAYSVHPIEALFISMSAPIFMLMFPVHLGVIFVFHILGVLFTMVIHSNLKLNGRNVLCQIFNRYTENHCAHHSIGNVNFGFVNSFWDSCFKTKLIHSERVYKQS